jgi:hypothetical protein
VKQLEAGAVSLEAFVGDENWKMTDTPNGSVTSTCHIK